MCQAATCKYCGNVTWAGCGQHVDEVMRNVPAGVRCPGHPKPERSNLLGRLFGR